MADWIRIDIESLEDVAYRLGKVTDELSDAVNSITWLGISRESGANVRMYGKTARQALNDLGVQMNLLGRTARNLSWSVKRCASMFESGERALKNQAVWDSGKSTPDAHAVAAKAAINAVSSAFQTISQSVGAAFDNIQASVDSVIDAFSKGPAYREYWKTLESTDMRNKTDDEKLEFYASLMRTTYDTRPGEKNPTAGDNLKNSGFTRHDVDGKDDVDMLIRAEYGADGKLTYTIAFEGSQEKEDWLNDFQATADKEGIHSGFNRLVKSVLDRSDEFTVPITLLDGSTEVRTMTDVIKSVQNDPNARMQISGHSLGGALGQVFTYHMLNDYGIPASQMETYTFASPVPFTQEALQNPSIQGANVKNYINENDLVPKVGVTSRVERVEVGDPVWDAILNVTMNPAPAVMESGMYAIESLWNMGTKGGETVAGRNMGENIYLKDIAPTFEAPDPYSREVSGLIDWFKRDLTAPIDYIAQNHDSKTYYKAVQERFSKNK